MKLLLMKWDLAKGRKQADDNRDQILQWLGGILTEFGSMSTNHQRQFVNTLLVHPNNYLALDAESFVLNHFIDDLIPERLDEKKTHRFAIARHANRFGLLPTTDTVQNAIQ